MQKSILSLREVFGHLGRREKAEELGDGRDAHLTIISWPMRMQCIKTGEHPVCPRLSEFFRTGFHLILSNPRRRTQEKFVRKLELPHRLKQEFATVERFWNSTAKTRGVDALILSWTKYESMKNS
jgi:hypothetical protein